MATAKPTLEDVELSEEQRLLEEEEAAARHSNIVKDKESKVKPQEQKEKRIRKRDGVKEVMKTGLIKSKGMMITKTVVMTAQ